MQDGLSVTFFKTRCARAACENFAGCEIRTCKRFFLAQEKSQIIFGYFGAGKPGVPPVLRLPHPAPPAASDEIRGNEQKKAQGKKTSGFREKANTKLR